MALTGNVVLAKEINYILDLPRDSRVGHKLLRIIYGVMAKALREGEHVTIKGFGTFKHRFIAERTTCNTFLTHYDRVAAPITFPAHHNVIFEPSPQLMAMLNGPTTRDERRAMDAWPSSDTTPSEES